MKPGPAIVAAVTLVALSGCTSASDDRPSIRASGEPRFVGPYASEFQRAWSDATTDLQRAILADESITARENGELQDTFVACMAADEVIVTWNDGGGFSLRPTTQGGDPRSANRSVDRCEKSSTGPVSWLYYEVRANPEKQDIYQVMASCLVREGLVDKGYGADDYKRDFEADTLPLDEMDRRFRLCNQDPLGLASRDDGDAE